MQTIESIASYDKRVVKICVEIPHVQAELSKFAERKPLEQKFGLDIHLYKRPVTKVDRLSAKVIMVIGGTGTGKTTLLNTLVTYCLGVEREDDIRYTIVDETKKPKTGSVTSEVSEYFIEGTSRNPPIIIIDTPGFGDTKGAATDNDIFDQIRRFIENKDKITGLHAVCFVGNATQ